MGTLGQSEKSANKWRTSSNLNHFITTLPESNANENKSSSVLIKIHFFIFINFLLAK